MILTSYIEPFIFVQSDSLISGNIPIKGKNEKVVWNSKFNQKEFIHVKVQPAWPKDITVIIKTERSETKKSFTI